MELKDKILERYKLISSGKKDFLDIISKIDGFSNLINWIKSKEFPKDSEEIQIKLLELIEMRLKEDEKIKQINVNFSKIIK